MSYLVRTRKTYSNPDIFTSGPAKDKWEEMTEAGKLTSITTTKVSDGVFEDEMVWASEADWLEYAATFHGERSNMPSDAEVVVIERRTL